MAMLECRSSSSSSCQLLVGVGGLAVKGLRPCFPHSMSSLSRSFSSNSIRARSGVSSSANNSGRSLLRLSSVRFGGSKIYMGNKKDFNEWENEAPPPLQHVIKPIGRGEVVCTSSLPSGQPRKLRGSGLHGPEHADVLRLVLWNRLKQRRPQREVPTVAELKDWYKQEVGVRWLLWAVVLFYAPMAMYGRAFAAKHDRYPWLPARTDGSRGEGPLYWFANY